MYRLKRSVGNILAEISTPDPETLLNRLALEHIRFSGARRSAEGIRIWIPAVETEQLRRLCREGEEIHILHLSGLQRMWEAVRRQKWKLLGGGLCLACIWASTFFVWNVEVTGCEKTEFSAVLRALEREGIGVGTFRLQGQSKQLENRLLLRLPALSRIAVNPKGTQLQILVREKHPTPEKTENMPTDVCAGADGVIDSVTALEGLTAVNPGQAVKKGDILISARWDSLSSGTRLVSAKGTVMARTSRTLTAMVPLYGTEITYEDEVRTKWSVIFGTRRINFRFYSGNWAGCCDKIREEIPLTLPGGVALPVCLVRERIRPVGTAEKAANASVQDETERLLLARLEEALPGNGEVLSVSCTTEEIGSFLAVTLEAECREDIGVLRPAETE